MFERLAIRVQRFLTAPADELSRWMRLLRGQLRVYILSVRRLREMNAMTMASALAFRTIFALVPTLVLAYVVLSPLSGADTEQQIRSLLNQAGLGELRVRRAADGPDRQPPPPDTRPDGEDSQRAGRRRRPRDLAEGLGRLVAGVERKLTLGAIGPIGGLVLIYSAVALLTAVERSLNRIFDAPRTRPFLHRALLYWSAVTLVPVVFLSARYATGVAVDFVSQAPHFGWLLGGLARVPQWALGVLLLAGVYTALPNARVGFRNAAGGALVAVACWVIGQWAFGLFVVHAGTRSIYGAVALLPLFLIWLYLLWMIFLFGAVLTYAAGSARAFALHGRKDEPCAEAWDLVAAAAVIGRAYESGSGPVSKQRLAVALGLPEHGVSPLIRTLERLGVICPAGRHIEAGFVPARPPSRIKLAELFGVAGPAAEPGASPWPGRTARLVDAARARTAAAMDELSLADVIADDGSDT